MSRLSDMLKRLAPALVVALLALAVSIAAGNSGLRDWVGSKPAASEVASSPAREAARSSGRQGKRGPQGRRGRKGRRGPRGHTGTPGLPGPQGVPGTSGDQVYDFTINWQGQATDPGSGATTSSLAVPGIGTLALSCPWAEDPTDTSGAMTFAPAADNATTRGVAAYTTIQGGGTAGASSFYRLLSTQANPIPIGYTDTSGDYSSYFLPSNGMITGTLNIEPFSGAGATPGPPPASFILSSEYVANDPDPADRFCHISGQVITRVG
jgi:hypothetical protein